MQYKCTVKNTLCRKAAEIYMSQDPHWTPHPPPHPPPPSPRPPTSTPTESQDDAGHYKEKDCLHNFFGSDSVGPRSVINHFTYRIREMVDAFHRIAADPQKSNCMHCGSQVRYLSSCSGNLSKYLNNLFKLFIQVVSILLILSMKYDSSSVSK